MIILQTFDFALNWFSKLQDTPDILNAKTPVI